MAFDVAAALRWMRFDPGRSLKRRAEPLLPFARGDEIGGSPLLLDTCVYIDQMRGTLPDFVAGLVAERRVFHSTVAVQELMHTIGVLRPDDARTPAVVAAIRRQVEAMQSRRIVVPDDDTLGRAALLSGILCRLQGYARDDRLRALQDCTLFLQGQKLGLTVLTRNIVDFDYLLQLVPMGRMLFYRTT